MTRPLGGHIARFHDLRRPQREADEELLALLAAFPLRLASALKPLERLGRKLIMTPDGAGLSAPKPRRDETLINALVRAHRWRRRIESGKVKSIPDLAEHEGVTVASVCLLGDSVI